MQYPHRRNRKWLSALVLLVFWVEASAMDLDKAIDKAMERDAGLQSLKSRVLSYEESAPAEAALPDPQLFLGAEGIPVNDPFASDMMTMYMVGIRQEWPAGQTRRLSGERSLSEGRVLEAEWQARRLEIEREVRLAWLDWAGAFHFKSIAEDGLEALDEMLDLAESRFRAGTARQRDVDQARLERSVQARRVLDRMTAMDDAASRLARWTGQWPDVDQTPDLPNWNRSLPERDDYTRLAGHPAVEAQALRVETGRIEVDLARQSYRLMWMIEAGYGHQRGSDPMGGRMSDKLFGMVSMSLPLFTGNRQDRRVAAAEAEADARIQDHRLRLQEWQGRFLNQRAAADNYQRRLELLEEYILPEAERTLESTLQAYRSDRATFDELVRTRLAELEQRMELIETRLAVLRARVELAWLAAEDSP
jgi:outer membrane protein TolC